MLIRLIRRISPQQIQRISGGSICQITPKSAVCVLIRLLLRDGREAKREPAADIELTVDEDFAAMRIDNTLADRQPQAAATGLARPSFVDAIEAIEQAPHRGRWNAIPGILYNDDRVTRIDCSSNRNFATGTVVMNRVADQIHEDLSDAARVGHA